MGITYSESKKLIELCSKIEEYDRIIVTIGDWHTSRVSEFGTDDVSSVCKLGNEIVNMTDMMASGFYYLNIVLINDICENDIYEVNTEIRIKRL